MFARHKKLVIIFLLAIIVNAVYSTVLADTSPLQQAQDEQANLQQQLQEIESQIAQYQQELNNIKGQKNTLQNKIKQLKNQQAALNLQIKSTNLQITNLENQLAQTQTSIDKNNAKIFLLKEQLGQFILLISEQDNTTFIYMLVAKGNLSDALDEIENYSKITQQLNGLLGQTLQIESQLVQQKADLTQQQDEAENLLSVKTLQQQQLSGSVSEQNNLLQQTKGKEADYQITLNDTQRRAVEIRNRLYDLLGVSRQVTFGEAVTIAQWASQQTGVRAAFLLAILTQESSLGKNVGTCNRPGDPPEKSWKVVMKPDRDQQPFLQITGELGMDPDITPVSCPMRDSKGNQIGWGGAMGPAQFIPSTWMAYKDRVAAATGSTANPWDIRDAFLAAAIKLKAGGAGSQSGEWAAAMRYFSGGTNPKYSFYGDSVVVQAVKYQDDIDALSK